MRGAILKKFIFILLFVLILANVPGKVFAGNCEYPMGEPGRACCHPDDPSMQCCATLDTCNFGVQCACNDGNYCDLATGGSMLYMACYPEDIECGEEIGQPCCNEGGASGTWKCNKPDTLVCNFDDHICEECGSETQLCCNNSTKCDSGLECYGGVCKNIGSEPETDCNESNELCCYDGWGGSGNTCQIIDAVPPAYEDCYCEGDLVCTKQGTKGICTNPVSCGELGLVCCDPPLTPCNDPTLTCSSTTGLCGVWEEPGPPPPPELVYKGPVIEKLEDIIGPASKILYSGGLVIGFFFIILSGYRLMTSQGDPQKAKEAQEQLTSAVVGTIFILLSANILRIIIKIITDIDI